VHSTMIYLSKDFRRYTFFSSRCHNCRNFSKFIPELVNTIHDIVRLHFADLKRALFGQGNYEPECAFQHSYVPHTVWTSKTTTEKEKIFPRFLKNRNLNTKMIQSSDGKLTVPNVKRLARKPGQRHRPKTVATRTIPRYT
jgi:hypothetical protein